MTAGRAIQLGALLLLAAVCSSAKAGPPGAPAAPDPHLQLNEILNRPIYQVWRHRQENAMPDVNVDVSPAWSERLLRPFRAIGRWIDWLLQRSPTVNTPRLPSTSADALPVVLKVLAGVVLVVAICFLAVLLMRVLRNPPAQFAGARVLSREQLHDALESGDALALGPSQWVDEARRLALGQNFRAVYRALYLALLSGLHNAGKIEHSRNRTNWTYVSQYRGPTSERETFGELTDLFDRVWYGRQLDPQQNLEDVERKIARLTTAGSAA